MTDVSMIASDVVDALLAELQSQRDLALKRSVELAAQVFSLAKVNGQLTAELQQEREVIKPALLAEIAKLKCEPPAPTEIDLSPNPQPPPNPQLSATSV